MQNSKTLLEGRRHSPAEISEQRLCDSCICRAAKQMSRAQRTFTLQPHLLNLKATENLTREEPGRDDGWMTHSFSSKEKTELSRVKKKR